MKLPDTIPLTDPTTEFEARQDVFGYEPPKDDTSVEWYLNFANYDLFSAYGTVDRVTLITDRLTGRSRGFGFIEMPDDSAAQAAIEGLNGTDMEGQTLTVNVARAKSERRGGGGRQGGDR